MNGDTHLRLFQYPVDDFSSEFWNQTLEPQGNSMICNDTGSGDHGNRVASGEAWMWWTWQIYPSPLIPIFIAFYDAAWAVRKDGKSQGG